MGNNELQHHGVKGMKWGVRRDMKRLSKTSKRYYKSLNDYNQRLDSGQQNTTKHRMDIAANREQVSRLVTKLNKKYASVNVLPKFDTDGYTIKWVENRIAEADALGRISNIHFDMTSLTDK